MKEEGAARGYSGAACNVGLSVCRCRAFFILRPRMILKSYGRCEVNERALLAGLDREEGEGIGKNEEDGMPCS